MTIDDTAILYYYFKVSSSVPQFYCKKTQFNKTSANFALRLPPVIAANEGYFKILFYNFPSQQHHLLTNFITNFENRCE